MAEQPKRSVENGKRVDVGSSPPEGFWVIAKSWWDGATMDSGSVKLNLAMLFGVTLAAMLCIWSVGGAIALIIGSVHVWSLAGTGVGVASALMAAGIQLRRKRPKP